MRRIGQAISILLLVAFANTSFAAINMYMKLVDGTQILAGESIAKGYEGWIELGALGEVSQNPLVVSGGNNVQGRINIDDFNVQGYLSSASVPLQALMYKGTRLTSVDIVFVNTSSTCVCPYYKIHLESVYITSISGSATSGDRELQQITFSPLFLAWAYYKQDAKSGVIPTTPTNTFGWSKAGNAAWTYNF